MGKSTGGNRKKGRAGAGAGAEASGVVTPGVVTTRQLRQAVFEQSNQTETVADMMKRLRAMPEQNAPSKQLAGQSPRNILRSLSAVKNKDLTLNDVRKKLFNVDNQDDPLKISKGMWASAGL